jgi:hypothetical protein
LLLIRQFLSRQPSPRIDFISELPEEIGVLILSFLDVKGLNGASRVNRKWHRLIHDNDLWRRLCRKQGWAPPKTDKKSTAVASMRTVLWSVPDFCHFRVEWKRIYIDHYVRYYRENIFIGAVDASELAIGQLHNQTGAYRASAGGHGARKRPAALILFIVR